MIKKLLKLLTPAERKHAAVLLVMIMLMGLLDMVSVASIMPFMAVLGNPEIMETNAILNKAFTIANNFGIDTTEQFLFTLGIFVFVFLVVSLVFKAFTIYAQLRFTLMREYSIGKRLVEGYLHQPYSWFLNRHSADLGMSILSEVNKVVSGGISPMMNLISSGTVATVLLFLLILVDPKLAIIVGLTLASAYALIFKTSSSMLKRSGEARYKANQERFTAVSEAFAASKEVKVGGLEETYIDRFSDPAHTFAGHQATASIIGQLPRFALEAIAFGGMLLIILYLMTQSGNFASALPIIVLYAFATYKLMPALQATYNAVTQLRFAGPSIDALYQDLMSLQPDNSDQPKDDAMSLNQSIKLNHIKYCYPNAPQPVLKDFSITIPARNMVGLVGATSSGKTTTVDLILGLLEAQEGTLEVDGQPITQQNRRSWQRAIGYVPQQIYLADDTVSANIAFGVSAKDINHTSVERAARIASLHEFVSSELPQQYQTTIGERGVRLSGGQRQRIGLARALYHNPQVLILDEATSALDNLTEQAVMEAIHNLGKQITIIIIAHRLSTVKACDTIYLLEKGELKGQGNFEELMKTNKKFITMAST
jgi:ATP-binding cassette, subfamily B, bacterial PglK